MQNTNQTNSNAMPFSQSATGPQPSQTTSQFFTNATQGSQVSESNPFVSDLRGEFTSNFGTNTNSVSQIFREGGYSQNNTKKWILMALLGVVCIIAVIFIFQESKNKNGEDFVEAEETQSTEATTEQAQEATTEQAQPEATEQASEAVAEEAAPAETPVQENVSTPSGSIELLSMAEGSRWDYDETTGPVSFAWSGAKGGTIIFSRNANMRPAIMRVPVTGNSYEFYNPYPGTWYWKVESSSGSSEVRSFTVNPPVRRNVALQTPSAGGTLAANGGEISWTEDTKVAFYRVEFSADGSWVAPAYKYATSGTRLSTQNLNPGQYQLRIGAFSEVAGRWEYTQPISVNVQ